VRLRFAASVRAALAVAGAVGLTACTSGNAAGEHVTLHVTPAASLADQPVSITVSVVAPGTVVSLHLRSTDAVHLAWSSSADFRASAAGSVAPASMAARSGSYTGRSAMGLVLVPETARARVGLLLLLAGRTTRHLRAHRERARHHAGRGAADPALAGGTHVSPG
jgi:hypothetical protein